MHLYYNLTLDVGRRCVGSVSYTHLDVYKRQGALPVPLHLRNAPTKMMREMGYGKAYKYPHSYDGHHVAEHYLPDRLRDVTLYQPSTSGYERTLGERLRYLRGQPPEDAGCLLYTSRCV